MRAWTEFVNRLTSIVERPALDRDMDEQMRVHIEMQTEANVRAGMDQAEALRAARVSFGSTERFRAECRDERRFGVVEDAALDARFAARSLIGEPSFTVAAVLALGLGIGATTAIYSLADHVMLRPVSGVASPADLVLIGFQRDSTRAIGISRENVADLGRAVPALSGLAGYALTNLQALPEGGAPLLLEGETVVGDYFGVLGVQPGMGRFFSAEELAAAGGAANVAVISHGTWATLYGGSSDIIGRSLRLNAHDFTIIGVAPRDFRGPQRLGTTQVWLPAPAYEAVRHFPEGYTSQRRSGAFRQLVGRLAPGATAAQAEAQLRSAMAGLVEQYPEDNQLYATFLPTVFEGVGTAPLSRHRTAQTLKLLGTVAALVLLIACANVANLILFRSVRRHAERAVRRALGADRGRLLRQNVVEGLTLALAGSVAGGVVAFLLIHVLRAADMRPLPPLHGLTVDARVFAFAVATVIGTGLLCGLIGLLSTRRTELLPYLRRSSGATSRGLTRSAFTIVQVAASIVLLSGALLLLRSLDSLRGIDVGVEPRGVMVFGLSLDPQGYDEPQSQRFLETLTSILSEDPRIASVATGTGVPVIAAYTYSGFRRATDPADTDVALQMLYVSEDYFTTLGMRLVDGRGLQRSEAFAAAAVAEHPVVISEGAARALFGDVSPLGRTLVSSRRMPLGTFRVVGITTDVRRSLREPAEPAIFLPQALNAFGFGGGFIITRSTLPAREVQAAVEAAVHRLDPAVPLREAADLRQRIDATLSPERLLGTLIGAFALLAVLLAGIGLYGVIAYAVAQRRREMGIRSALGAQPLHLVHIVSRQAVAATCAGSVVGVAAALAGSRLLETWLFGVQRLDIRVYLLATALLMLTATLAATLPARAAARTDPMQSLRTDQ